MDEYAAAYCRRTHRPSIDSFAWYEAFHLFRSACILQGILGRVRDGTAASDHATDSPPAWPARRLAWEIAKSLGA